MAEPIRISTPLAEAELYRQGAHVTQWTPHGQRPVLYLSPRSLFQPGKAIRGGVPVIFPWFGPRRDGGPGPSHGFARTSEWDLETRRTLDDGREEVAMVLGASEGTRGLFEGHFHVRFRVRIGTELEMQLETTNVGSEPFAFEEALHTYLAVGDVRKASITGLEGGVYQDKGDGSQWKTQGGDPIQFAGETDRVYINTSATCTVQDPVWLRRIVVEKRGSASTVVWNPWVEKSAGMADMAPESWMEMVCVETANVGENAIRLLPRESHAMTATIRVE